MTEYLIVKDKDLIDMSGCIKQTINTSQYCIRYLEDLQIKDMMKINSYIRENSDHAFIENKSGDELIKYINDYYFGKIIEKLRLSQPKPERIPDPALKETGIDKEEIEKIIINKLEGKTYELHLADQMIFLPRGAGSIDDKGWGCAWRALQTQLSSYIKTIPTLHDLYYFFGNKQKISEIYNNVYTGECKYIAPYEKWSGWADPYMSHIVMLYYNLPSTFAFVHNINYEWTGQFNENINCIKFDKFLEIVKRIIKEEKKTIMVDDNTYAYSIIGYHEEDNTDYFWVADPHMEYSKDPYYLEGFEPGSGTKDYYIQPNRSYMVNFPTHVKFKHDDLCENNYYKYNKSGNKYKISHYDREIVSCEIENKTIKNIKTIASHEFIRKLMAYVSFKICQDAKDNYILDNNNPEIIKICKSLGWTSENQNIIYKCEYQMYVCGKVNVHGFTKTSTSCWIDTATTIIFMSTNLSKFFRKQIFESQLTDDKEIGIRDEYIRLIKASIDSSGQESCSNLVNLIKSKVTTDDRYKKYVLGSDTGAFFIQYMGFILQLFNIKLLRMKLINFNYESGFLFRLKNKPNLNTYDYEYPNITISLNKINTIWEAIDDNFEHFKAHIILNKFGDSFRSYLETNLTEIIESITDKKIEDIQKSINKIYDTNHEEIYKKTESEKKDAWTNKFNENKDLKKISKFYIGIKKMDISSSVNDFKFSLVGTQGFLKEYYKKQLNTCEVHMNTDYLLWISIAPHDKKITIEENIIIHKEKYNLEGVMMSKRHAKESADHQTGFVKCKTKWYFYDNQQSPILSEKSDYIQKISEYIEGNTPNAQINLLYFKSFLA